MTGMVPWKFRVILGITQKLPLESKTTLKSSILHPFTHPQFLIRPSLSSISSKKVLPIFYQVNPSKVHKQRGNFGKILTKLEKQIKDKMKVQRWRDALSKAANISGWDDKNRYLYSTTYSCLLIFRSFNGFVMSIKFYC